MNIKFSYRNEKCNTCSGTKKNDLLKSSGPQESFHHTECVIAFDGTYEKITKGITNCWPSNKNNPMRREGKKYFVCVIFEFSHISLPFQETNSHSLMVLSVRKKKIHTCRN